MSASDARRHLALWIQDGTLPLLADAEECVSEALQQGVVGLLHVALHVSRASWPAAARERLAGIHRTLLFREEQQAACARRVLRALHASGAHALPLKGLALTGRFYDPGLRPMSDIDILVLDGWPTALRVIRDLGLRPVERADHARTFEDPASRTMLELHHSVTSCPGLFPMDGQALWARASPRADAPEAREPSPEDLLLQLALHAAFQHGLVLSLVQFLDFRRLLEGSALDGSLLRRLATEARAEVAVGAALRVAEGVVGAPVSGELRETFSAPMPRALAEWITATLADPLAFVAPSAPHLARVRWHIARGRRLELLRRTLLPREPGEPSRALAVPFRAATRGARLAWRWLR